ncbi:MAG: glycosyltransferase family 2 protein [Acidobacteria bacterium]|nr:glycosyltransferase family 2 protein [Acidobacteriota bacterium]
MKYKNPISVIIPVYNEEDCIKDFLGNLLNTLKNNFEKYEVIAVNDGSSDKSVSIIKNFKEKNLKLVGFSQNQGQSAALYFGVRSSNENICVTLDSDGQNDPSDIKIIVETLKPDSAVIGIRKKRKDYAVRKLFSYTARKILNIAGGVKVHDPGCTLKAFYREDFLNIPFFNGMHRFIPYLLNINGIELIQIPVKHYPRLAGKSKYGLWSRTFRVLFDISGLFWLRKRSKPFYHYIQK